MIHEEMFKALRELVDYIRTHGHIDDHGHRKEEINCESCRILNQAEAIVDNYWVPEATPTFRPWTKDIK